MTEKRQLNQEELEQVSGGAMSVDKLRWENKYGDNITIRISHSYNTLAGVVEKRGYYRLVTTYFPVIYVKCASDERFSRWYLNESAQWVKEANSEDASVVTEVAW